MTDQKPITSLRGSRAGGSRRAPRPQREIPGAAQAAEQEALSRADQADPAKIAAKEALARNRRR